MSETSKAFQYAAGDAVKVSPMDYETVAASQTDQVLGLVGKVGDYISHLVVSVATAATGTVDLQDGSNTAFAITAANTPIGVYVVWIQAASKVGAWSVTTGAGATVVAVGHFTHAET